MSKKHKINRFPNCYCFFFILVCSTVLSAQNRELVWADEFTENEIDRSKWDFGIGPTNDNIHYYTGRRENIQAVNGILNIIALEESYMGFNYTSALLKTSTNWQYGRVEARIKLPATNGFVPAFWMLPSDNIYGWWPNSGEIDIMEHPTNEVSNVYGTIHSEAYNYFTGIVPQGSRIEISDAETDFHIYAVEWTENQIDFYVDDQIYFSFSNDHSGSATWPFDKPFYIILNLAVGGGWVGNPDETTIFPAIMKVDYVRVYQDLKDIAINGADFVPYISSDVSYSAPDINGVDYSWEVPGDAEIVAGQNTNKIFVEWDYFGGNIKAQVATEHGPQTINYPVKVSANLLSNPDFEKGVKYWTGVSGYPASVEFDLTTDASSGNYSLRTNVKTLGNNPWDIQVSQRGLEIESGKKYEGSFWAKANSNDCRITMAIINSDNFFVYKGQTFSLTESWSPYSFQFTANTDAIVNLNMDMGSDTGIYYLDDFLFTTPELYNQNQLINPDFTSGSSGWNFIIHGLAQATGSVENEEYAISMINGGNNTWDVHLGQEDLLIENGKDYVVSFDAYASNLRDIYAIVGKNSEPWTVYYSTQKISLTTTKKRYSYSFTMNDPTDSQARLGFDVGASSVDVFFDNIRIMVQNDADGVLSLKED